MRLRSSAIQSLGSPSGEELWGGGAGLGEETGPTPLSGPLSRLRPSRDYLSPCDPTRHPSTFFLLPLSSFPFLSCAILCAERCCLPFAPFDPSCKTDTSFRIRVFLLFPGGSNYPFFFFFLHIHLIYTAGWNHITTTHTLSILRHRGLLPQHTTQHASQARSPRRARRDGSRGIRPQEGLALR